MPRVLTDKQVQNLSKGVIAAKQLSARKKEIYESDPIKCGYCSNAIPYEKRFNRFCNSSCHAKNSNSQRTHSSTTRNNISQSLKEHFKSKSLSEGRIYTKVHMYKCVRCGNNFWSSSNVKNCRQGCRTVAKSEAGRKGSQTKVVRSKDEIALYNLCESHFLSVDHNIPLVDGWDADIIINDFKVAVLWDGPWHRVQMPFGNHSLSQVQNRDRIKEAALKNAGWIVVRYSDAEWSPNTAFENLVERFSNI